MSFPPDSRSISIVSPRDTLSIRDLETGQRVVCTRPASNDELDVEPFYRGSIFSRDGKRLYATTWTKQSGSFIEVWDVTGAKPTLLEDLVRQTDTDLGARSMDISKDGKLLAIGTVASGERVGKIAQVYRLPEMQFLKELSLGESGVVAVRFSPDGKYLATCGYNPQGTTLWDTSTWQQAGSLLQEMPVTHISWSDDGSRLASSDFSATTKLWDIKTRQVVSTFRGAASAFSPDGTILAVGAMGSDYVYDSGDLGEVILHRALPLEEIDSLGP